MDDCVEKIVESLSCKIETALSDVSVTEDSKNQKPPKRSWKQRSNTKKHAWGSCRCLSSILLTSTNLSILEIRRALSALINCIRYYDNLNEKIPAAAISTLSIIPREIWSQQSSGDYSAIGYRISVCLVLLYKVSDKLQTVPTILLKMITQCNHICILCSFKITSIS